jgi:hypothetical protein
VGEIALGSARVAPPKAASSRTDKYSATARFDVGSLGHAPPAVGVGDDNACVDRESFAAHKPFRHATCDHGLEEMAQQVWACCGMRRRPAVTLTKPAKEQRTFAPNFKKWFGCVLHMREMFSARDRDGD